MSEIAGWSTMRSYSTDRSVARQRLTRGTLRRIMGYAARYKRLVVAFLALVALGAALSVANPLLLRAIIDDGIIPADLAVVGWLAAAAAGVALLSSGLTLVERMLSARLGEGLIYDLRGEVFDHVQRMPVAFFVRTQTGALVSRLNSDVIGAQRALTGTLSAVLSNALSLVIVLTTMLLLSWQVTVVALVLLPVFVLPARWFGRKLAQVTREQMQRDAEMSSMMTERFNVSGAILAKLYGRPREETAAFSAKAGAVRDLGVSSAMYSTIFFTSLTLLASLATAITYGFGGFLVVDGRFQLGTLVAITALLARLYGPLTALSNVHVDVMTALVSFDRVFEVLDLEPMITEREDAVELPADAASVEFDGVSFGYPGSDKVSLASLESVAHQESTRHQQVIHDVSFRAGPGEMIALVGASGAGKTTLIQLASRLYDTDSGTVRIGGRDVREVTLSSLYSRVGVVTQDAHLFHDTIRANLRYARPSASEEELLGVLRSAHLSRLLDDLPDGLDTVVGDRGYRLSGGEKQRLAIARLLLKAPGIVVLDEATAHLDSESEAAVQRALASALAGRTSLVIAHRLATVRSADQILVVHEGRIAERGTHTELLAAGGHYAELYRTQFADQDLASTSPASR
ncbi:ABC transporter [Amycolatopsis antarctica]|uniref:ABC transporter n=1 Tax=Amycolatopsis antarctica TaxID=1854586 RepID=A0A263CYT1_9PSEU|nr:ABC transporter ATP-binding protein [Amycolatopsis antarctica]OZM71313.1 ABC transporter [Amycolatopsis antarctica]